jgi:group I intron endonuclease
MGYIYILTSPIGKSYIGQTILPIEKRFQRHQRKSSKCAAIYNAIQKYGWENFEKDWYECPDEDLNFDENLLVREMGTIAPGGYNLKEGGGNGKLSEETKQKIGGANMGKIRTEEYKQKKSESQRGEKNHNYGKEFSEETKQKIREARLGTIRSEETKQRMSEAHTGEKNHNAKKVYQYDLKGNYVRSFVSHGEAARHLGTEKSNGSSISACVRGVKGHKTAYGFQWSSIPPSFQ